MITVTTFFAGFMMSALTLFTISKKNKLQIIVCVVALAAILGNVISWGSFKDGELIFKNFNDGSSCDRLSFIVMMIGTILAIAFLKLKVGDLEQNKEH